MLRLALLVSLLTLAVALPGRAADRFYLKSGDRILFLGDSITFAGMYVQYVQAFLATRFPEAQIESVNLGLPSETVTGLSEPDHPFPRPDVHERLDRALAKVKPTVVVMCYGMNDGIYYPFAEERFAKYRAAYRKAIVKSRAAGARVTVLTPPPFDPLPLESKVLPEGAPKYSWMTPYRDYDSVLARYGKWLLTQKGPELPVVDAHGAVERALVNFRKADPGLILAGDGIHLDSTGHALMALSLLKAWGAPARVDAATIDVEQQRVREGRVSGLTVTDKEVGFTWISRLPMPFDPKWDSRLELMADLSGQLNRHRLRVLNLSAPRYSLYEGDAWVAEVSREQLKAGLELTRYPKLSTNVRAAELLKLVQQRERLVSVAWLTDVGHKRPQTPVGLPLAEAQARAAPLTARIQELAQPVALRLRLVPAG